MVNKPTTFESDGYQRAKGAIEHARMATIKPVHIIVTDNENSADTTPSELYGPEFEIMPIGAPEVYKVSEDGHSIEKVVEETTDDIEDAWAELMIPDESGLYRVDVALLQTVIANAVQQAASDAYILGRLDQMNDGTNKERFIRNKELPSVADGVEWIVAARPEREEPTKGQRIIARAIKKYGSLRAALLPNLPEDQKVPKGPSFADMLDEGHEKIQQVVDELDRYIHDVMLPQGTEHNVSDIVNGFKGTFKKSEDAPLDVYIGLALSALHDGNYLIIDGDKLTIGFRYMDLHMVATEKE